MTQMSDPTSTPRSAGRAADTRPALDPKPEGFRQSMAWLHTWSGLLLGWVLFAMFLTGTLAFFRPEITTWMKPDVHTRAVSAVQSADVAERYLSARAAGAKQWFITLASPRAPVVAINYQDPKAPPGRGAFRRANLDPETGETLRARETRGGDFFYRFHFDLEMGYPWGRWLASIAGMFMLIAIISGVITHKKIFSEFFTFRPKKGGQRAWMDGHNALSVLGLPFHLMITFSGVVLFAAMLMPAGISAAYDSQREYFDDVFPSTAQGPANAQPATLVKLSGIVAAAQAQWPDGQIGRLVVNHPGDSASTVVVTASQSDRISYGRLAPSLTYSGVTGELISQADEESAARVTLGTLIGLHLGLFAEPVLRWLYFLVSLAGTAMVATGLVLWVKKRRQKAGKHAANRLSLRLVDGLNAGTVVGVTLGTALFFLANRLIDADMPGRSAWEVRAFLLAWLLSTLYAFVRPRTAWRDLTLAAAVCFTALPVVNALTTERHFFASFAAKDWVFVGFDLTVLATGVVLFWLARRLSRPTSMRSAS